MKLSHSECCTLSVVDILVDGGGMSAKLFSFTFCNNPGGKSAIVLFTVQSQTSWKCRLEWIH